MGGGKSNDPPSLGVGVDWTFGDDGKISPLYCLFEIFEIVVRNRATFLDVHQMYSDLVRGWTKGPYWHKTYLFMYLACYVNSSLGWTIASLPLIELVRVNDFSSYPYPSTADLLKFLSDVLIVQEKSCNTDVDSECGIDENIVFPTQYFNQASFHHRYHISPNHYPLISEYKTVAICFFKGHRLKQ